jgi:hypothetical protein
MERMARNQGKQRLDQSTRDSVSALSQLLMDVGISPATPRQPGEFTIEEAAGEAGMSRVQMSRILSTNKALKRRKMVLNGKACWLYSKKD